MGLRVYDRVWTMVQGKPSELVVYAVTEVMALQKGGAVEVRYRLVKDQCGATLEQSIQRHPAEMFSSKDELLQAFVREHSK